MNTLIPNHKYGICNCPECNGSEVAGRKVAKTFMCLRSYSTMKLHEQMDKAKKKHALKGDTKKIKAAGLTQNVSWEQKKRNADSAAAIRRWFDERRKEMTGKCSHCGGRSEKHNDKMFYYSIAHIFQKAYFKSIATNENNWIELCYHGNSCHANYDNHIIDLIDLNCFDEVITKFVKMYPDIAPEERRRIPQVLMQYIETEK